jgi:hypothetical protein
VGCQLTKFGKALFAFILGDVRSPMDSGGETVPPKTFLTGKRKRPVRRLA